MKIADLKLYNFKKLLNSFPDQKSFAQKIGISQAQVSLILNQNRHITDQIIEKICNKLQRSSSFFFNLPEESIPLPSPKLIISESLGRKPIKINADDFISIPIIAGGIGAGREEIPLDIIDGWAVIQVSQVQRNQNLIAIRVTKSKDDLTGMSMYPIIGPGDIVAIDRNDKPQIPLKRKIYAVRKDEGITL